jgi:hypothetical protein
MQIKTIITKEEVFELIRKRMQKSTGGQPIITVKDVIGDCPSCSSKVTIEDLEVTAEINNPLFKEGQDDQ